jgi:lysyl-tRNA synthetase class 2
MTNQSSIQEVLFFPQMRPEKFEESKADNLKENEQAIYDVLLERKSMNIEALKSMAGLSNKQWDKGLKALGKLGLTKATKTDAGVTIDLME